MAVTAGSSSARPTRHAKEGLVRHDSGQSSSRATPVSSTEGEYDEEEEEGEDDDDDDDDDVEDEEEEGDEEEGASDSVRFDEQFLAQLLAFDPTLAGQANATNAISRSQVNNKVQQDGGPQHTSLPLNPFATEAITRHTPSNSTNLPFSAPTPSNEFFDGAINFLTEVLGSSTPNFWNSDASLAQSAWPSQGNTPSASVGAIDFTAPAKTEFKNLQPLISNLIARLKGFPIQEGQQIGQTLEDDLVVLLQSLMAHRQAQQTRQGQEQPDQSMTMLQHAPLNRTSFAVVDPSASASISASALPDCSLEGSTMNSLPNTTQPGFSFVDFDFGDDDDDPDFVPKNVNLDFANSADFADALAQVSAAPVAPLPDCINGSGKANMHLHVDDDSWQQVMNALQSRDDASSKGDGLGCPSPWNDKGKSRRTRSATRNLEMSEEVRGEGVGMGSEQGEPLDLEKDRSQSGEADYDRGGSFESENEAAGRLGEKKRGRKAALSKEEALERRRESNRECSRRSRLRKKQEEEEIRQEFVRIQQLRLASQESQDPEKEHVALPAGLRKKKRGRPFGSKSYANRGESEMISLGDHSDQVADLKADNRMLRAEMQRLIEENAKLRARMLRVEEEGPAALTSSRSNRLYEESKYAKERHPRSALRGHGNHNLRNMDFNGYNDDDNDDDDGTMSDEEEDFREGCRASRYLPYDPTKPFKPPVTSRKSFPDQSSNGKVNKRKRNDDDSIIGPTPSIEQLLRGFAAYQQGGNAAPTSALPQTFPTNSSQQQGPTSGLM